MGAVYDTLPPIAAIDATGTGQVPAEVFASPYPVVLRGLVSHWPAVQASVTTPQQMAQYLQPYSVAKPVTAYVTDASHHGRFGYNEAFNGFNFQAGSASLQEMLRRIDEQQATTEPRAIYVGSTPVDEWLPGFREANDLTVPGEPLVNFWLGNKTVVSAHYDFPSNIACVIAGQRRFTVFPNEQVANLYVGPIDRTPSGQPISLVDFDAPDFDRFPRFANAMEQGQTAVLEPGDAIFIPSMWWHHVKALSAINMLVNYWWLSAKAYAGSPFVALMHALMTIKALPAQQRRAWRVLFDHYVFDAQDENFEHIPDHALGCLGDLADDDIRRLRAELINRLNQ